MRILTVRRTESFVGVLAPVRFYLSDPAGTVKILGTPCRLLCSLRSGQEERVEIGQEECILFAVVGRVGKNIRNDLWRLPAGEEDVALSGSIRGITAGFIFDGMTDPFALQNRDKNRRARALLLSLLMVCVILTGALIGLSATASSPEPKDFTVDNLTVTLNERFRSVRDSGDPDITSFTNNRVWVSVSFQDKPSGMELREYVERSRQAVEKQEAYDTDGVEESDGLIRFIYRSDTVSGEMLGYAYFYANPDGRIALVQFVMPTSYRERYVESVPQWAKSVRFTLNADSL